MTERAGTRGAISQSIAPAVLVIMGVSGSGKTTISALLAARLGWELADADSFHSAANVQKMQSGVPLTDEDRWPWLHAIAAWIDATRRAGRRGIVACSALKRSYREILLDGRPDVRLVYLQGDAKLIGRRMAKRHGHFMPAELLQSQFDTLEEPGPDENAIVVSVDAAPEAMAARILTELRIETPAP
jgi:gluconokinase